MARDKVEHEKATGVDGLPAGLREQDRENDGRGGCFKSNRLSSSSAVPVAQGDGSMDWAKVNHDGFTES